MATATATIACSGKRIRFQPGRDFNPNLARPEPDVGQWKHLRRFAERFHGQILLRPVLLRPEAHFIESG